MDPTNSSRNKQTSKIIRDRLGRLISDREDVSVNDGDELGEGEHADEGEKCIRTRLLELELSDHEIMMAENVIDPKDIPVHFRNIGGIDEIKSEIWDLVVLPLKRPDLFRSESGLVSAPKGILLYGQPGTGKTMLAKAIAKESGATFINVRLSSILNKWFGESNKSIAAIFSLAEKLAPSIIFIDEIDTFLGQREGNFESSTSSSIKSEFLTLCKCERCYNCFQRVFSKFISCSTGDGMLTGNFNSRPVMVLGATNHPYEVDAAILRRLPRTFEIGLPSIQSRIEILKLTLEKQPMTQEAVALIPAIADETEGYSGSDLNELCRAAAMQPIRELTSGLSKNAVRGENNSGSVPPRGTKIRPLVPNDFAQALRRVKKTGETAAQFYNKKQRNMSKEIPDLGNIDMNQLTKGVALLRQLLNESDYSNNSENDNIPLM
jgi:SpoVK/Ycf46/Vps4 family AAA+-type ATPase